MPAARRGLSRAPPAGAAGAAVEVRVREIVDTAMPDTQRAGYERRWRTRSASPRRAPAAVRRARGARVPAAGARRRGAPARAAAASRRTSRSRRSGRCWCAWAWCWSPAGCWRASTAWRSTARCSAAIGDRRARFVAEIAVGLLLFELGGYAYHRLAHAVPALWRLHEIHHSSETMDWLASFRQHPIEIIAGDAGAERAARAARRPAGRARGRARRAEARDGVRAFERARADRTAALRRRHAALSSPPPPARRRGRELRVVPAAPRRRCSAATATRRPTASASSASCPTASSACCWRRFDGPAEPRRLTRP